MKKLFIVLAVLAGCQHVDNASIDRGVFSYWENTATSDTLDMRGWDFGIEYPFTIIYPGGEECVCTFKVWGRQDVGNYVMNQCYARSSNQIVIDCNILNKTGTYEIIGNKLNITDGNGGTEVFE